jgi:hypothetical protein
MKTLHTKHTGIPLFDFKNGENDDFGGHWAGFLAI